MHVWINGKNKTLIVPRMNQLLLLYTVAEERGVGLPRMNQLLLCTRLPRPDTIGWSKSVSRERTLALVFSLITMTDSITGRHPTRLQPC
jgi:hypothetical protein